MAGSESSRSVKAPRIYRDTDAVRCAAINMGSHFFDADTMRFFGSRVGETTYDGRFFVTSEKGPHHDSPRRWTVRFVVPEGRGRRFDIAEAGEFQEYSSGAAANRAASRIARGPFTVRFDPYDMDAGKEPDPKRYQWRVYSGDVPLGNRMSRYAAQSIRADLERAVKHLRKLTGRS